MAYNKSQRSFSCGSNRLGLRGSLGGRNGLIIGRNSRLMFLKRVIGKPPFCSPHSTTSPEKSL